MKIRPFDRDEHVYRNRAFVELVKDAVRFFNGTPVCAAPPPEKFTGCGVYALYYTGKNPHYLRYSELNRLAYNYPIYVGKAVPPGWRKARASSVSNSKSATLFSRIREHCGSVSKTATLELSDFSCRFVIFEDDLSDMIGTVEASLIKNFRPLWNTAVDGFGNHTPGKGRFEQAKSDWDVIHPGRAWADKCKGIPKSEEDIHARITKFFEHIE